MASDCPDKATIASLGRETGKPVEVIFSDGHRSIVTRLHDWPPVFSIDPLVSWQELNPILYSTYNMSSLASHASGDVLYGDLSVAADGLKTAIFDVGAPVTAPANMLSKREFGVQLRRYVKLGDKGKETIFPDRVVFALNDEWILQWLEDEYENTARIYGIQTVSGWQHNSESFPTAAIELLSLVRQHLPSAMVRSSESLEGAKSASEVPDGAQAAAKRLAELLEVGGQLLQNESEWRLTRYGSQGSHYAAHFDSFSSDREKRWVTSMLYLNDLEKGRGGQTWFPKMQRDNKAVELSDLWQRQAGGCPQNDGLLVQPRAGLGILWFNYDYANRPLTAHSACPTFGAEKRIMTVWIPEDAAARERAEEAVFGKSRAKMFRLLEKAGERWEADQTWAARAAQPGQRGFV